MQAVGSGHWVLRTGSLGSALSAARRPIEAEAMGLGQQTIEDGIGDGGIADPAVPVLDRKLMGDDGGALACV